MTSNTVAVPNFWGTPTRYTVAGAGSAKLYATRRTSTRTVTTLRTATDPAAAQRVADDLSALHGLVELDRIEALLNQLAAAGYDTGTLANYADEYDPAVGAVWNLTRLLDSPPPPSGAGEDPAAWVAGPLLRTLTAAAAEPDAPSRALISELRSILEPLDGPVVTGWYEAAGRYNVAPWIDTLTVDQLSVLLLDTRCDHNELCHELLVNWSEPGGVLEDEATRIDQDDDFRLLVELDDVVRRLASTRPDALRDVYADADLTDIHPLEEQVHGAARLAAELLSAT